MLLIFLTAIVLAQRAAPIPDDVLQHTLTTRYVGQTRAIRGFSQGSKIRFDADGHALDFSRR